MQMLFNSTYDVYWQLSADKQIIMNRPSQVSYATFAQRLLAFNIDLTIFLVLLVPMVLFIADDRVFWCVFLVTGCLYHAGFESSSWQGTVGKRMGKLQVVDRHGNQLSFSQAFLRILLKNVSLLLFFCGFFMIYFRSDRRGLHDLLMKTCVVYRG
ncbi:RDD family protein [Reichenbachiella carrageenanivorans]|uniref:RDD family protein n=1 Tax=Reichenbachiella carrageenanivorans TaxID=2979869 RepID=A0ABY6CZV8_9BACT|nr:RDD family protein [Reichenbachiella carrageenanivorans]UXX79456.1 RDD family protein [Reichenbachiella carrageenanivorans]